MKTPISLVLFFALAHTCLASLPGPFVAEKGQMGGDRYELWIDYFEHVSANWNPEKDEWPMSAKEAILAARSALTKMVGPPSALFDCQEVRMRRYWSPAGEEKATFYFIVTFESMHEKAGARKRGAGVTPAILSFLVYPEGYVKSPTKKEPNASPEPAPVKPHGTS